MKQAVIMPCKKKDKEPGKNVCLYTKNKSRLLGRHETKQDAYKQEYAIEKNRKSNVIDLVLKEARIERLSNSNIEEKDFYKEGDESNTSKKSFLNNYSEIDMNLRDKEALKIRRLLKTEGIEVQNIDSVANGDNEYIELNFGPEVDENEIVKILAEDGFDNTEIKDDKTIRVFASK